MIGLLVAAALAAPVPLVASSPGAPTAAAPSPAAPVPFVARPPGAPTGTAVAAALPADHAGRQARLRAELRAGNVPAHLRTWREVAWTAVDAVGEPHRVVIACTRDYLAVGSTDDFLRVALDAPSAYAIAAELGAWLPTPLVVDRIWAAAERRLVPRPLPPGPAMSSPRYALLHRSRVGRRAPDTLVAGHKKDVVITPALADAPDQLAIYGWHRRDGDPIQPLSLWHGAHYADYSHGVRLIGRAVRVDGVTRDAWDILGDPVLWPLLSNEGPLRPDELPPAARP